LPGELGPVTTGAFAASAGVKGRLTNAARDKVPMAVNREIGRTRRNPGRPFSADRDRR
jgi:hypothetical protein